MASQSIPMEAGVFDILVIDEATQCTITNVLPLIFRAKRLVVIGDADQLPAIPAVGKGAESALSARYALSEDTLQLLSHNNNDLYRAAVRCMPGGRSRVRLLNEHYRSHPLIIGFSNQHVYQKKLRLRTKPASKDKLPFGSAIHGRNVAGVCARGEFGSSWINDKEATEVRMLLQEISNAPALKSMSIGVVTPFRAQEKLITDKIMNVEMALNIQIGTAHAFQGDERDIMIFSPVVSDGMTASAARWVEEPKNLINVAITRARQGLFVVADFAQCRAQPGILGSLIKYVDTVELLRKTSFEELDLFSWMTVQGWNPQVHKHEHGVEIDFTLTNQGRTLAIEVDGKQHEATTAEDAARDAMLVGQGYEVLRIPAREVREMPARVIQIIGERLGLPLE
jgi:superfamily I DNA and/or RNA helicase